MSVIDLIFPKRCLECANGRTYICNSCLKKVTHPKLFCLECYRPSIDGATHIKCKKEFSVDFAYSPWKYEGVVRRAILKLKYSFAFDISRELANDFCIKIEEDGFILPRKAIITSIPLHVLRKNWRGFNQSEELAKLIAKELNWTYYPDLLFRKKFTKPQTELKGKDRKENVLGVFGFNHRIDHSVFADQTCIVFDDVLTTGSTIREASKVLKRSGVKNVWGLTIAA